MKISAKVITEMRDYLMITVAMVAYCIGWNVFLLPNNITASGVPGVSSLLFWAMSIPVQTSYFIINAALLLVALKILGWKFCAKTIYAVLVLTALTTFARSNAGSLHLLADQPFMASLIGAIFCGSGIGMGLAFNGSTGGTDIVAAIVHKYRDISLGRVIMMCDILIISSSYLVFHNFEQVIYGYVVLLVSAYCVDQVVNIRHSSVQFFIISDKYKEIASRIAVYPHRGRREDALHHGQAQGEQHYLPYHKRDRPQGVCHGDQRHWRIWRRLRQVQGEASEEESSQGKPGSPDAAVDDRLCDKQKSPSRELMFTRGGDCR